MLLNLPEKTSLRSQITLRRLVFILFVSYSTGFSRKSSSVPQAPAGAVTETPMVTVPVVQGMFLMTGFFQFTQPSTAKGCS